MPRRPTATLLDIATGRAGKDPTAQAGGRRAQAIGNAFEASIEAVNAWYDRHSEATIVKVNPPVHGWGRSLRVSASTVDYFGTMIVGVYTGDPAESYVREDRVGIAFDAKVVTGSARFGPPGVHDGHGKDRARFDGQVRYLCGLRDRHDYAVGFLLHDTALAVTWWLGGAWLDELAAGRSVPLRTIRARRRDGQPAEVEHHLPHIVAPLARAALLSPQTRRPTLDYLSLIR